MDVLAKGGIPYETVARIIAPGTLAPTALKSMRTVHYVFLGRGFLGVFRLLTVFVPT
jgi:hypothetical protein